MFFRGLRFDWPDQIQPILTKYRHHQKERASQRKVRFDKSQNAPAFDKSKRTSRYNLRSGNAKIKLLQDAVMDIMHSMSDEEPSDSEYESATEDGSEQPSPSENQE